MSVGVEAPAVVFGRERVVDVWDEIMPLLHENHADTGFYKDIPLDPEPDAEAS